jgi:hypothetical protein
MRESDLWKYVKQGMMGKWHVTRIESSAGNGVPDVSFGLKDKQGWVELKYIPEWPKRSTTKVKLPLRPEQKHWINARGSLSGHVWVLCRIQDDFYLLDHLAANLLVAGSTKEYWDEYCTAHWVKRIDFDEFYGVLYNGC